MEPNKRLFIAFSITMILIVAMFTSLGRSLLSLSTPSVILPTLSTSSGETQEQTSSSSLYRIEVTPKTVQSVITALQSESSYSREISTTLFWPNGSFTTEAQVFYDNGRTKVVKTLPSGDVRHDLIIDADKFLLEEENQTLLPESAVYYWYDDGNTYLSIPSERYTADLAQSIPTYQNVLNLGVESIHQANFQIKEGISCIYVEATPAPLFYTERYWISTETGLLVGAETYEGDKVIYRFDGYAPITTPLPSLNTFTLPDGTTF